MSILQKIKKKVSMVDMFYSSEMLRYDSDSQYQTFTGGLVTLVIVMIVIIGFFNMISETLNRTAINSTLNVVTGSSPPLYKMVTNKQNMFMFAIQILSTDSAWSYNIGGAQRYFDLMVQQNVMQYGIYVSQKDIHLEPCTDQHFDMIPQLVENKASLMYQLWYCPPINSQIPLQGSYFSSHYSYISIVLSKCSNSSGNARPCYPQEDIDRLFQQRGNFYFAVNYINTVVNPNEVDFRSYYLQPMDFLIFSKHTGAELHYDFSDYEVQTDKSIWPFQDTDKVTGLMINSKPVESTFSVGEQGLYAFAFIAKSSRSYKYKREVQKVSAVLSYIGGLVGAISAVLFIIKTYTDMSLQVAIACGIFDDTQEKEITQKQSNAKNQQGEMKQISMNIVNFLKLSAYQLLRKFKFTESWRETKKIYEFRQQINNHLDVKNLLHRISNLERYLSYFFDSSQLACLKYQKKLKMEEIKKLRIIYSGQIQQEGQDQQPSEQACTENGLYKVNINNTDSITQKPIIHRIGEQQLKEELKYESNNSSIAKDKKNMHQNIHLQPLKQSRATQNRQSISRHIQPQQLPDTDIVNCAKNVEHQKEESAVSKKIWQNLNKNVKILVANENDEELRSRFNQQYKIRSTFKIQKIFLEPKQ